MKKGKKLLSMIVIVGLFFACFFLYYVRTDSFQYFFTQGPVDEEFYVEVIMFAGENLITKSKKNADEMIKFSKKNRKINEVFEKYESGDYKKPINIEANIDIINGETVYTYSGIVTTKEGETINYFYSFSIDCVPTLKIPEVFISEQY